MEEKSKNTSNINIEKFKENNAKPFLKDYKNLKEIDSVVFVFESDDTQFITNNITLSAMIKKEFNIESKKVDFEQVNYRYNLTNSMFVKDETLGNLWVPGILENNLALILTSSPENLKKFVPIIVQNHLKEFDSLYDRQIFEIHENLPELYISVCVDKCNSHKTFSTKEDLDKCESWVGEMIDKTKLQKDNKCKTL